MTEKFIVGKDGVTRSESPWAKEYEFETTQPLPAQIPSTPSVETLFQEVTVNSNKTAEWLEANISLSMRSSVVIDLFMRIHFNFLRDGIMSIEEVEKQFDVWKEALITAYKNYLDQKPK